MKKTLKLLHPILVNGEEISEFEYDTEEISAEQFSIACSKSAAISKSNASVTVKFRENDNALHLYLGFMAIIAVNPGIDIADLERVKGTDLLNIADIGQVFTLRIAGVDSEQSSSEEQSENTAEPSTPASEN